MKTNIVVSAVRVSGYWYLRVKYDENDCRVRYQQSTGLKIDQSSRQVEQARRRVLAELYEINRMDEQCEKWDISPELRYQPVSEWLKRWLDDCRESIAESTLVRYTAVVRHACHFFDKKGLALCRVSPMAMEEYRDAMLAYGYSARTVQMHFKLLQTAFTSACSCGLNRSNPICGVQLPRVERNIPRPYSAAEQQKLLEELKGTDLHLPVLLALLYGMRIGEICGLCWEDIDWEKKLLHVRHNAKRVHDESGALPHDMQRQAENPVQLPFLSSPSGGRTAFASASATQAVRSGNDSTLRTSAPSRAFGCAVPAVLEGT